MDRENMFKAARRREETILSSFAHSLPVFFFAATTTTSFIIYIYSTYSQSPTTNSSINIVKDEEGAKRRIQRGDDGDFTDEFRRWILFVDICTRRGGMTKRRDVAGALDGWMVGGYVVVSRYILLLLRFHFFVVVVAVPSIRENGKR